jgi:hypothetical protein
VIFASLTFSSISVAVRFVLSKFSTNSVSPRKFEPADDKRAKRLSSRRFNVILNLFCCLVKSDFKRSRSGRSYKIKF